MPGAQVNIRDAAVYKVFGPIARQRLIAIGTEGSAAARANLVEADSVKSGRLLQSIDWELHMSPVRPSVTLFASAPYALYYHEGTGEHPIVGNYWLRFFWEKIGKQVKIHAVNHPGYGGNPFLRNAMFEVTGRGGFVRRRRG